jgi:hypothetical protein
MTEEHQEYPKYLYHPTEAPAGRVFKSADETRGLARKGWVDTPSKFPRPSRIGTAARTWWFQWEWAVKALAVLLGVMLAVITLIKALWG